LINFFDIFKRSRKKEKVPREESEKSKENSLDADLYQKVGKGKWKFR
jgi:hypothetical protein